MKGRKPKSKEQMEREGSRRATDERRRNAPDGEHETPECPPTLSKAAREIWNDTIPLLENMGVLCLSDKNILVRYCNSYALYIQLQNHIDENGTTYEDAYHNPKNRPEFSQLVKITNDINKMESKLGLSPSDRVNVRVENKNKNKNKNKDKKATVSKLKLAN